MKLGGFLEGAAKPCSGSDDRDVLRTPRLLRLRPEGDVGSSEPVKGNHGLAGDARYDLVLELLDDGRDPFLIRYREPGERGFGRLQGGSRMDGHRGDLDAVLR